MKKLSRGVRLVRDILWTLNIFQYKVELISDNPNTDLLQNRIIYVVGNEKYVKWAYLKCPSNCDDVIMLSLIKSNGPSWRISQDKLGRPTIYPSIHKLDGCKSHFWIRSGKINWASD